MSAEPHPPAPRVRLRVGVSGHRVPPKLPARSEAPLRALLDRMFAAFAAVADEVVVVSSLAEGSDRLVAEAGLKAGFALQAVLPFTSARVLSRS